MSSHFLPFSVRSNWLAQLQQGHSVFFPAIADGQVHWERLTGSGSGTGTEGPEWGLRRIRAAEPAKTFFFKPREKVASLPDKFEPAEPEKRVLFGVKNCDLLPLAVHERMFLGGEFEDPFYEARLRNTVLIAADCPEPEDSCFCNLVGRKPFVTEGADIVLSVLADGWLLEPLSDKGEELLRLAGAVLRPASEAQLAARDDERKAAVRKLEQTNPKPLPGPDALPKAVARREKDAEFWKKHAATCVECYGCLFTCPTCYCFLLYDRASGHDPKSEADSGHIPQPGMERTKVWDACYIAAYARVGGGANPRAEFLKRFVNRFQCKFQHFPNAHGFFACSGCGRCYKVCMGKIDIRKVLEQA